MANQVGHEHIHDVFIHHKFRHSNKYYSIYHYRGYPVARIVWVAVGSNSI